MKVSSHPISSHRDLVPSRPIPGLIPSHPGPTPGWDGTRMGYSGPGGQPSTVKRSFIIDCVDVTDELISAAILNQNQNMYQLTNQYFCQFNLIDFRKVFFRLYLLRSFCV